MVEWMLNKVSWEINMIDDQDINYALGEVELDFKNADYIQGVIKPTREAIDLVYNTFNNMSIKLDDSVYDLVDKPIFKVSGDKTHFQLTAMVEHPTEAQLSLLDVLQEQLTRDVAELFLEWIDRE